MKLNNKKLTTRQTEVYLKGYDDGAREQAQTFEKLHGKYEDMMEAVEDYHKFNKYGEAKPNYCLYILGAMFLGMITYMIIGNHNYGMISA